MVPWNSLEQHKNKQRAALIWDRQARALSVLGPLSFPTNKGARKLCSHLPIPLRCARSDAKSASFSLNTSLGGILKYIKSI